jgi:hypothetical protein
MRTHATRVLFALFALGVLLAGPCVQAQQAGVQIDIQREHLGLGGIVQRGVWTPVRVDLTNNGAENVEVHCRWLLTDEDGDELITQRSNITLQPLRTQGVWLYATPPMSTRPGQTWVFQAVEVQSGELLEQVQLQLSDSAVAEPSVNLVGVCGFKDLGLTPWLRWSTHHEELRLVRGLSLETLPDRWYGLDSLSSLVWMPDEGGEPTDSRMSDSSKRALREWVYRGGHLVIVMPYAGQQWTGGDSGLADLIEPIKADDIVQTRARAPISVFGVLRNTDPVALNWFDLDEAKGYISLADVNLTQRPATLPEGVSPPPDDLKPLVVGKRFGFGQVTLVGIDLSNVDVLKSIDAFRLHRIWTRIFSWRASKTGELLPNSLFDGPQTRAQYWEAKDATQVELGNWMGQRVAREGQTGAAIGLAFVLFVLYIIFAAGTFPNFLKTKGWQRHSWMLFVCIVALFSIVAWGGAWVMRPATTSTAHFTVLDIDGNTNMVRAQSWQSLLIPTFGTADVQIGSENSGLSRMDVINLLASPGNDLSQDSPGYPDQRSYVFDAEQPSELSVPMRSTTKSLKVDFLGQITGQQDGLAKPWNLPQSSLRVVNKGKDGNLPVGTITHNFPGELRDVLIIYCPGGAQQPSAASTMTKHRPLVYEYKDAQGNPSSWKPGTPLALPNSRAEYSPLWVRPSLSSKQRFWDKEGYLGAAIRDRSFGAGSGGSSNVTKDIPLLSFYGALPPPLYEVQSGGMGFGGSDYNTYGRSLVRDLDLTHLITGRRIILIGHLRDSPSPVPLTVDGDTIPNKGWTVVRWIYDL